MALFSKQGMDTRWTNLENISQLDGIERFVILKHSTRCAISRMVLKTLEQELLFEGATFFNLDLLVFRSVSDAISAKYNVRHESPQLIIVENGIVVYQASHDGIDASEVNRITNGNLT